MCVILKRNKWQKTCLNFEPHLALFVSDSEPLIYYRFILKIADLILLPGGRIYFEINEALGKSMIQLVESFGYSEIELVRDLNNKERILKARKNA